jgi:hypothetical protein
METFWLHEKSYPFLGVAELKRGSPFRDISLLGTLDVGDSPESCERNLRPVQRSEMLRPAESWPSTGKNRDLLIIRQSLIDRLFLTIGGTQHPLRASPFCCRLGYFAEVDPFGSLPYNFQSLQHSLWRRCLPNALLCRQINMGTPATQSCVTNLLLRSFARLRDESVR